MKHHRARRLASDRITPIDSASKAGVTMRRAAASNDTCTPSGPKSPEATSLSNATRVVTQPVKLPHNYKIARKLSAPPFVFRRRNGGAFKSDTLPSLYAQPKDIVRLKQNGIVQWRLNRWAQDLLEYTQAQQAAKARANTLIELSTTELAIHPAMPINVHSKLARIHTVEGPSLLLGFCVNENPTAPIKVAK